MSNSEESNTRISAEKLLSSFGHRESLVLFAIVSFGILGSILCFTSALAKTNYSAHNLDLLEDALVLSPDTKTMAIKGERRVGEKLAFQISEGIQTSPLYMDYGDGEIKRINNTQTVFYNYSFPGQYQLNLFTVKNNQKKLLSTEKIEIAPNTQLSILK